jgi:LPS export ABC transporter protein LptC
VSPHSAEVPEAPFAELAPLAPGPLRPPRGLTWRGRLSELVAAYLPVLLMGLLAALTWWLVKNTPMPGEGRTPPLPREEPDYTMRDFTVTRYQADGALRARLEGDTLQHFPATDTIKVEQVRLRSLDEQGRVLYGTADHGISNGDATQVRLMGSARVVREPAADEGPGTAQRDPRRGARHRHHRRARELRSAGDADQRPRRGARRQPRLQPHRARRRTARARQRRAAVGAAAVEGQPPVMRRAAGAVSARGARPRRA